MSNTLTVPNRHANLPNGFLSPVYRRLVRPGGVVARTLNSGGRYKAQQGEEVTPKTRGNWRQGVESNLESTDTRHSLGVGKIRRPRAMQGMDPRRDQARGHPSSPQPSSDQPDLTIVSLQTVADTLQSALSPIKNARHKMEGRVPALAARMANLPENALPARVDAGPIIGDALVRELIKKSPALLSPGIQEFPNNAVRLLDADPEYIAAFLAGANHEFTRELLWREYPATLGWTSFRRFWDRPDPTIMDIEPMSDWPQKTALATHGSAGGETAILLIKGDVIRQYPGVRILLLDPDNPVALEPSFTGTISPDIRFLGFDIPDLKALTDPADPSREYKIIIEELPTQPRFGLDLAHDGTALTRYDELSWQHVTGQMNGYLDIGLQTGLFSNTELAKQAEWGLNSAHMASATYQKPFRRIFNATDLLRG